MGGALFSVVVPCCPKLCLLFASVVVMFHQRWRHILTFLHFYFDFDFDFGIKIKYTKIPARSVFEFKFSYYQNKSKELKQ